VSASEKFFMAKADLRKQGGEPVAAEGEQPLRASDCPYRVGEALPARLFAPDLMQLFGIKHARFYQLQKAGRFDRFEIRPTIGRRAWSGKLVMAYFDQEGRSSRFVR
jgi:hypothetical protein